MFQNGIEPIMKNVNGIVKLLMLSLTGSQLRSFVESHTVNLLKRLGIFYKSPMRVLLL